MCLSRPGHGLSELACPAHERWESRQAHTHPWEVPQHLEARRRGF
jgi:hypothetical protein